MLQTRFLLVKAKNLVLPTLIYTFTIFLVLFSSSNLSAAKNGLILWAMSVVPSLLPFFIATELLSYTNIINILGKILNRFMMPLFNVPGEGAFALIMGIISGYPIGAKIVSNLKAQEICTDAECERLISFTNNSGPLFVVGTVGISLFSSQEIGLKLLTVHILSCVLVGVLFRFWKGKEVNFKKNSKHVSKDTKITLNRQNRVYFYNLGEVLSSSIQNAIKTTLVIGGFVVLFSVIVSMLESSKVLVLLSNLITPILNYLQIPTEYANSIIVGLIEVTNGVKLASISNSKISIIICSFLLGFGGISVLFQVLSITSKAKISIKPYIIGKLLQAIFSAIFMCIIL